jgi:TolB-like protein
LPTIVRFRLRGTSSPGWRRTYGRLAPHKELGSAHPHPAASSSADALDIDSLIVLPLVNDTGNADKEYLADGITESLIRSLSQLPKLKVLSRNTAFRFKGKTDNPQQIASRST